MEMEVPTSDLPETCDLLPVLNEMFKEAIRYAVGSEYEYVISGQHSSEQTATCQPPKNNWMSGSAVQPSKNWRLGGDFQCSCASAIFCRATGTKIRKKKKNKKKNNKQDGQQKGRTSCQEDQPEKGHSGCAGPGKTVLTVAPPSPLGLPRSFTYRSARELAHGIAEHLPEAARRLHLAAVHVAGAAGLLVLRTRRHAAWHLSQGRLPCPGCPAFPRGARGLRMHRMAEHGEPYAAAESAARAAARQPVPLPPRGARGGARAERARWAAAAAAYQRARKELGDPGLEAARRGDVPALVALCEGGWDPAAATDAHGSTALMWAAGEGHAAAVRYLLSRPGVAADRLVGRPGAGRGAAHWAARHDRPRALAALVEGAGADPDLRAGDGTTPLHFAAWAGARGAARYLVERAGADVGALNAYGCNASQWASAAGDVPMLAYLQRRGLDVRVLNRNGHSAAHKAAAKGQAQALAWLLRRPKPPPPPPPIPTGGGAATSGLGGAAGCRGGSGGGNSPGLRAAGPEGMAAGQEEEEEDPVWAVPSWSGGGLGLRHLVPDADSCCPAKLAEDNGHPELAAWIRLRAAEIAEEEQEEEVVVEQVQQQEGVGGKDSEEVQQGWTKTTGNQHRLIHLQKEDDGNSSRENGSRAPLLLMAAKELEELELFWDDK